MKGYGPAHVIGQRRIALQFGDAVGGAVGGERLERCSTMVVRSWTGEDREGDSPPKPDRVKRDLDIGQRSGSKLASYAEQDIPVSTLNRHREFRSVQGLISHAVLLEGVWQSVEQLRYRFNLFYVGRRY